jgi:phosphate/sulfate permease
MRRNAAQSKTFRQEALGWLSTFLIAGVLAFLISTFMQQRGLL